MKVSFKKNQSIQNNLSVLLQELHNIKRLSNDGKDKFEGGFNISFKSSEVSFINSTKYEIINSVLVKSIIDFKGAISDYSKDQIVKHSLNEIAVKNITCEKEALKIIDNQYKQYYRRKTKTSFNLLATISIDKLPFNKLTINEATVLVCNEFPTRFLKSRASQFNKHHNREEETSWTKVVITVEDQDFQDALQKAHSCLEVLRAFLCLQIRSWRSPLITRPINQILVGDFLTLHKENGECYDENFYWYEPLKRNTSLYQIDKDEFELLERQTPSLIRKLNDCNLSHNKALIGILCQYVSAYDLVNKESCFLRGWTVLENLLCSHQNEIIIKRSLIVYKNPHFHRLQIEALKNYRNELVHEVKNNIDDNGSDVLNYCYMLLDFLTDQISFNLNYCGQFSSIAEYAEYLDYLCNKENITRLDEKFKGYKPED